ncbi:cyanophycinase [Taibaiella koreensis]|uniref:cyanophycinase n=1 Tax=Taibaiella koreensis TaxID=1268548 RepID=UPI000E59B54A|nr:cyanophycinase [Taibaiella koreensis]
MDIKGILVSVGGAEDKGTDLEEGVIKRNNLNFFEIGILKTVTGLLQGPESRIEVVTTASSIPEEVGQNYLDAFVKLGYHNVGHLDIRDREDAHKEEFIQRVRECSCLMFSGGNQLRLSSIFGGTEILDIIRQRYEEEHFVISGTSAGAMAMSNTMIYEGNAALSHLKGEVKITTGLGFVQNVIIDSHFDKRGRFMRLAQAVAANPGAIGIGLGEDTGIIIREGHQLEAIGSGGVIIIDGRSVGYNNIGDAEFNQPISVENLKVHIMEKGNAYDIKTRRFEPTLAELEAPAVTK